MRGWAVTVAFATNVLQFGGGAELGRARRPRSPGDAGVALRGLTSFACGSEMAGGMKFITRRFSAAPEGAAVLFFIQIFATLGFAVLYSTVVRFSPKPIRRLP